MKTIGLLMICALAAAGAWVCFRDELTSATMSFDGGIANTTEDNRTWDEKNRRPASHFFYWKAPDWMRGKRTKPGQAEPPKAPVPSAVQGNPFSQ